MTRIPAAPTLLPYRTRKGNIENPARGLATHAERMEARRSEQYHRRSDVRYGTGTGRQMRRMYGIGYLGKYPLKLLRAKAGH